MRKQKAMSLIFVISVFVMFGLLVLSKKLNSSNCISNQTDEIMLNYIRSIRNEDVKWSGTYVGLMPIKLVGATLALQDSKEDINPLLIDALLDRNRFVAAHVLLTSRMAEPFTSNPGEWNNLKIQISSNGDITFKGNNLLILWIFWKQKLCN